MAGTSPAMTGALLGGIFTSADLRYSRAVKGVARMSAAKCGNDRTAEMPTPDFAALIRATSAHPSTREKTIMTNGSSPSLPELERRIAIARDNIRQLIEQAAAFSGAGDEERNADRLAEQNDELERLIKQRDALLKK
jgi:hypothetical protein